MELTFEKLFFKSVGKLSEENCVSVVVYDLDTSDTYIFSKEKTLRNFLEDINELADKFDNSHLYQTTVVYSEIIKNVFD